MVGFGSIEQVVDEGYPDVVSEVIFATVMHNLLVMTRDLQACISPASRAWLSTTIL
jgi:hypothetical protein